MICEPGCIFGLWTVLRFGGRGSDGRHPVWVCRCVCGKIRAIDANALKRGMSKGCHSCRNTRHGKSRCPEYRAWTSMMHRCYVKGVSYKKYGAKGITVCHRWRESVDAFMADVGPRPSPRHSIDRYPDKNGNYEPGNVRWATLSEQNNNRSCCMFLTLDGITKTCGEWCSQLGLKTNVVWMRKKLGWSDSEALQTPVGRKRGALSCG